jgi:hypothetical protein
MTDNAIDPHPDVIGKIFGKLTVLEFEGFKARRGFPIPRYVTVCICNRKRKVFFPDLDRKGGEYCPYCHTLKVKQETALRDRAKGITQHGRMQAEAKKQAQAAITKKYQIDLERVTRMLLNDREYARTGKLLYEDGRPDEMPPDKAKLDPRAAVQATMALGAMHGLVTKRTEVTIVDSVERMRDDELIDFIDKLRSKLEGYKTIELNSVRELPLIEQPVPEIIGYEDED